MRRFLAAVLPLLLAACPGSGGSTDVSDAGGEVGVDGDDDGGADEATAEGGEDGGADEADADGDDAEAEMTGWDGDVPVLPRMSKEEHVASCMRTRACFPENPQQLATCTAAFAHINGREIGAVLSWVARCVNDAGTDCDAIRACMTNGEAAATCEPLRTPDRCDGSVLRQCSRASSIDFVFDCARLGLDCFLDADGAAACGLGTCDTGTFRWSCGGDTVVACELGVVTMAQCDAAGLACVENPDGGVCAGTGAACTEASDPRRCDGSRVLGCISGRSADIDCDAVIPRWTCGDRAGAAGCVAPGDECTAAPLFGSDIDESCDGEAVVSCLDGWIESFSCSDLGLGPCTVLSGGHAARCTVP